MKKLLRNLRLLDPKEFQRLDSYLHSPPSRTHSATLLLFQYLQPHYPEFQHTSFESYSGKHFQGRLDKTEFRLRCSYLLSKVYSFLAQEELENNPCLVEQALIKSLIFREEYHEADRKLKSATNRLASKGLLESNSYFHEVQLKEFKLDLSFSQDMQTVNHNLEDYFDTLDRLHIGMQLKYLLPSLTSHRVFGTTFPWGRWEHCHTVMEKWGDHAPPLARMSYHLLHLFLEGSSDHFLELSNLVETHADRMSVTERMNVYGYMQNYLTQLQSQGEKGTLETLNLLYQRMDREGLIFGRGDFSEHLVRNIVITSCRLGETEWAGDFLTQNKALIVESAGENVYAYVSAFQSFYVGDYSKALQTLQKVKFSAPLYRTGHQTLLLRIYFEIRDIESIEAVAETFRRYLNRSRHMSDRQKDLNRNFISVVQLLARARDGGFTTYRQRRIAEYLQGELGITDRTWLAEKYKEVLAKG